MENKSQLKYVKGKLYDYEIYKFVDQHDPILSIKPEPYVFGEIPDNRARYLAVSLLETMKENYGVGLAANQCGISSRVFVIGGEGVGFAFFNPEILETSGEILFSEGCLSFQGLFLPIRRPETVKIKYQDMDAVWHERTFSGFTARIILHEYDHMEGIVFTSKVPEIILNRAKTKVRKNLKILARQRIKEEKEELIRKALENLALDAKKKVTADDVLSGNI